MGWGPFPPGWRSARPLELAKPEDACGVLVGEVDADAIVADQVHVLDREVLGHRGWIEQPLASRFRLAMCTAAADPQLAGAPYVLVAFVPHEPHLALSEADDLERHGHRRVVPLRRASVRGWLP